jgi:hypothetical protein
MFFSKARKWKKVGDAVLSEVHPLILLAERQMGKKISVVSDDNYILGFITGLSVNTGLNLTHFSNSHRSKSDPPWAPLASN